MVFFYYMKHFRQASVGDHFDFGADLATEGAAGFYLYVQLLLTLNDHILMQNHIHIDYFLAFFSKIF